MNPRTSSAPTAQFAAVDFKIATLRGALGVI
jgi:hypothetical protein